MKKSVRAGIGAVAFALFASQATAQAPEAVSEPERNANRIVRSLLSLTATAQTLETSALKPTRELCVGMLKQTLDVTDRLSLATTHFNAAGSSVTAQTRELFVDNLTMRVANTNDVLYTLARKCPNESAEVDAPTRFELEGSAVSRKLSLVMVYPS